MAYDVFISYASEDKNVADAVCAKLESNAVRCWIAPRDVLPGTPYGEAIIDAILGCRIMILVFSSKSNNSPHIPKEIERAVSAGIFVIPFRIEDVRPGKSLDYFIGNVHWLDALTRPLERHLERLAQDVQMLLSRDAQSIERSNSTPLGVRVPSVAPAQHKWLYAALGIMAFLVVVLAVLLFTRRESKTMQSAPILARSAPATTNSVETEASQPPEPSKTSNSERPPKSNPAGSAANMPTTRKEAQPRATNVPANAPSEVATSTAAAIAATPSSMAESFYDEGNSLYRGKQFLQAAELFGKACDGGERKGCHSLGLMYREGQGVAKDLNRAQGLFERACDAGGSGGCIDLGSMYLRGEGVPKDLTRARNLFERSCDEVGGMLGCVSLGTMYRNGEGVTVDLSHAAELYQRACNEGAPPGCTELGIMYRNGQGEGKDARHAADLFKRACDMGGTGGCLNLGSMYRRGEGVPTDLNRAAAFFQKACDGGNERGCEALALFKKNSR